MGMPRQEIKEVKMGFLKDIRVGAKKIGKGIQKAKKSYDKWEKDSRERQTEKFRTFSMGSSSGGSKKKKESGFRFSEPPRFKL